MRLVRYRRKWAVQGNTGGKLWRQSLRTADRDEAERLFRDFQRQTPGATVGHVVESYLGDKAGKRSHGSMLTAWRALRAHCGHLRPDQIDRQWCRDYAEIRRRSGVSDGTIIKDLGVLKAALNWAKTPGATFEFPPTPLPRERYITAAECQRLAAAADLGHVRLFITLAWSTAGRHSALLEMTWDQVEFDTGFVRLARKAAGGNKRRATVQMPSQLRAALVAAYGARTCEHVIEWGGKPLKSIKRGFGEAARKAGMPDVTPHVLRHSAAVAMAAKGISMEKIAQVLGHTSMKVTERVYARFAPGHLADAARALEWD